MSNKQIPEEIRQKIEENNPYTAYGKASQHAAFIKGAIYGYNLASTQPQVKGDEVVYVPVEIKEGCELPNGEGPIMAISDDPNQLGLYYKDYSSFKNRETGKLEYTHWLKPVALSSLLPKQEQGAVENDDLKTNWLKWSLNPQNPSTAEQDWEWIEANIIGKLKKEYNDLERAYNQMFIEW